MRLKRCHDKSLHKETDKGNLWQLTQFVCKRLDVPGRPDANQVRDGVAESCGRHGGDAKLHAKGEFDVFSGYDHHEVVQEAESNEGKGVVIRQLPEVGRTWDSHTSVSTSGNLFQFLEKHFSFFNR